MKQLITMILAGFAVAAVSGGTAYAQTPAPDAQNHEAHHPEAQAPATKFEKSMDGGMMGSMKMDDMQGMMHECMEMHKDGKMCDHQAMEKCQANMKKGDCQKMMKQAKAKEKAKK